MLPTVILHLMTSSCVATDNSLIMNMSRASQLDHIRQSRCMLTMWRASSLLMETAGHVNTCMTQVDGSSDLGVESKELSLYRQPLRPCDVA